MQARARSVVSTPPSAGSSSSAGSSKALTDSSQTSSSTASRAPSLTSATEIPAAFTGTGNHDAGRFATFAGETTWTPSAQPRPGSIVIATWSPSTFALVTRKLAKTLAGTANTPDPIVSRAIVSRQRTSMSPAAFQSASSSTRPCWCRTRVSLPAGSKPHLEKSPFMVVILR